MTNIVMEWYEKLLLAGIAIGAIGGVMYIVGLSYAISANRQARAEFRAAIQQAHDELRKLP